MSTADGVVVHGLRAAARVAGRSPSGIEKLVDAGRLPATRQDGAFVFALADLEALPPPQRAAVLDSVRMAAASGMESPSTAEPVVAMSRVEGMVSTGVHASVDHPSTGEQPPLTTAPVDAGAIAGTVFADLAAGHTLVQIVIDRSLPPEVVQGVHALWRKLSDVDGLSKPTTIARLEAVERLAELAAAETGAAAGLENLGEQVAALTRGINTRLAGIERRGVGDDVRRELAGLRQRLAALEQVVRAMPAAPMPIGRPCPGCGHAIVVPTACSGCGAGRAVV